MFPYVNSADAANVPCHVIPTERLQLYHNRLRRKNPEATTPSAESASAKEAQTVVDPEVVTVRKPESPRTTHPFYSMASFLVNRRIDSVRCVLELRERDGPRNTAGKPTGQMNFLSWPRRSSVTTLSVKRVGQLVNQPDEPLATLPEVSKLIGARAAG